MAEYTPPVGFHFKVEFSGIETKKMTINFNQFQGYQLT